MDRGLTRRLDRWLVSATREPRALSGLALARIGVALAQLSVFLVDYSDRAVLFGPRAFYPPTPEDRVTFDLFALVGRDPLGFEIVYHAGILACAAMAVGLGGRLTIVGAWALCWSAAANGPLILDGGDNLAMIVMPALALSRCCERLSLRTGWRWTRPLRRAGACWLATLLSNAAALGIALQLCMVYLLSGLYKAQGAMWVDGTALYYILRTPEFFHPVLSPLVLDHDAVVVLGTYGGMLVLIAFPFLVIGRSTRLPAVIAMMGFHAGIAFFMGLTSFALVMIACDCIFVAGHVDRMRVWSRHRVQRTWKRVSRRRDGASGRPHGEHGHAS